MGLKGRYFSDRDMRFINSISAELMGDIVENIVTIYKISVNDTETNIYGEATGDSGKWYLPGVAISALIERPEMSTDADDFGPTRNQNHIFKFREAECRRMALYPDIGDIVAWNGKYYEIDNNVREQLLGGIAEKSFSIIVNAHYTKLSAINIKE